MQASKEFRFILQATPPPESPAAPGESRRAIPVPPTPSMLRVPPGAELLLEPLDHDASDAFVVEPLTVRGQDVLLIVTPEHHQARHNGQPLPRVALLAVKDELQLSDNHLLHVTVYHRPRLGAPDSDVVGRECPLCRVPFTAETRVYVCPHCGTALHAEGEDRAADERLECVHLGPDCPNCQRPVVLREGYAWLPEAPGDV